MAGRGGAGVGLVIALALGGSACFSMPERQASALQERIGGSEMSPAELRIRVRDLAGRYSAEIETLVDELTAATPDPRLRLALLRFKIDAIPQMQNALFLPDPVAALIDAWTFLTQIQQSLREIAKQGRIPPEVGVVARERFGRMDAELARLWGNLTGREDVSSTRARIDEWAAAHPLESLATRQSTVGLLSELTARAGVGALGAASYLLEDTQDIAHRMEVVTSYLPRQARWQAELMLREMLTDPTLLQSGENPQELLDALARLIQTMGDLPALFAAERNAIFGELGQERLAMQDFVTAERVAALNALEQERATVMAQSELVGAGLVDRAFDRATELVGRILLRLVLLAAILGLVAIAVALILTRGERDRRPLVVRRTGKARPLRP